LVTPRPAFDRKFRPGAVKEAIHAVLTQTLGGQAYEAEAVGGWSREIADRIKGKIRELGYDRYKVRTEKSGIFFGFFLIYCLE
jgi:hypothetical protein